MAPMEENHILLGFRGTYSKVTYWGTRSFIKHDVEISLCTKKKLVRESSSKICLLRERRTSLANSSSNFSPTQGRGMKDDAAVERGPHGKI